MSSPDEVVDPVIEDEATAPVARAAHPLRGVVMVMGAVLLFACNDITTKHLVSEYNVPLVAAVRYIVHCLLMAVILVPRQGRALLQTKRTGLVIVRGLCLVVATACMGLALQRMPAPETVSIVFLAPMLVVLAAGPLLGERVGIGAWVAVIGGFAGVLLIVRPGGGLDAVGVGFVLIAVAVTVVYYLLSRVLAHSERTLTILFYAALIGAICFGLMLPWFWYGKPPEPGDVALFLSMGVTAGLGHYLFTAAHREAPASLLAPVNYMQLLWVGLLSWLVFGHVPDGLTLIGMAVVAASGIIIAVVSTRKPKA